jgi:hypothetical protein
MSIERTDIVDIISTDRMTGDVILTISDHLDWSDTTAHQRLLQVKLNRYLAFIEGGEMEQSYPDAKGRSAAIEVVFKFVPDDGGRAFLAKARDLITDAGFTLRDKLYAGAAFN